MKYVFSVVFVALQFACLTQNAIAAGRGSQESTMVTTYPSEYPHALRNPLKGFRPDHNPASIQHEYATLVRHYIRWNQLENDESDSVQKIRDFCNSAWQGIEQHGIKVIPRVYLDWDSKTGNEYWPADLNAGDYSSPEFKQRLVRLIHRLGEVWDNDPRVAWIQVGLIGLWGEHHSPEPTPELETLIGDAFTQAFVKKKFLVRRATTFTEYEVGIYWDRWADSGQMTSFRGAVGIRDLNNATEPWKNAPMEGEIGYGSPNRFVQPGDDPDDTLTDPEHLDYLIDSIRDLHGSALGWVANYSQDDPAVREGAEKVQKAFGYRFILPQVCWSRRVEPEGVLQLSFSVVNAGSAPLYADWPLAFGLLDKSTGTPVWTTILNEIDIRQWFPGDDWDEEKNVYLEPAQTLAYSKTILLPGSTALPAGEYIVALAVINPVGRKPVLRFAIKNHFTNGWHPFGVVGIGVDLSGPPELAPETFVDPMKQPRLWYALEYRAE